MTKEVVARKEYPDDCRDHLDFGILVKVDGKCTVDIEEAKTFDITDEDIAIIQAHCDKGWKILKGEKHEHKTGWYEGDRYSVRFSLEISAILDKYNLWYED